MAASHSPVNGYTLKFIISKNETRVTDCLKPDIRLSTVTPLDPVQELDKQEEKALAAFNLLDFVQYKESFCFGDSHTEWVIK